MSQIQFHDSFDSNQQRKWLTSIARFEGKLINSLLNDVGLGVAVNNSHNGNGNVALQKVY